mgnify:CR=1 FL=1
MIACMGGWCRSRVRCTHYHYRDSELLTERLCGPIEEPELGAGKTPWFSNRFVPLKEVREVTYG